MRIHALLITALLSVQTFDIHAANISGAAPPSTVKTVSPDTCTNKLMSQSNYMKGLMEQIQSLIKRIKAVIDNQPHPPNTRGMNPDDAEELKRQYQNALDQWRLRLTKLQNKLKATQKKLIKAENELKATKRDCHKKQNEQVLTPKTELNRKRINSIQSQSKKHRKEATQMLKRIQTLLQ